MIRNIVLLVSLLYLIACTRTDQNNDATIQKVLPPRPVPTGIHTSNQEEIQSFSIFLSEMEKYQMIAASQADLQEQVREYLPDSSTLEGYDLHLREIGSIDTFRLVFHEYFDLYDGWSKTYLNVFSTSGQIRQSKKLLELSSEGNTSINVIDDAVIEIVYHDFFLKEKLPANMLALPAIDYTKDKRRAKRKRKYKSIHSDKIEGTIYEYFKIEEDGQLLPLSQAQKISFERQYPQASFRLLSISELEDLSSLTLAQMENEILAQHGYIFEDDLIATHFQDQPWYVGQFQQVEQLLSEIETRNLTLLRRLKQDF